MNKKTKLAWLWGTVIVLVIIIGSAAYFLINGGTAGLEANKIKATNNSVSNQQEKSFNNARTLTNYPTMEDVRSAYKKRFGDPSYDDINKIESNLNKIYSSKIANLAARGLLLSNKMTPDQVKTAEVTLADNDSDSKDFTGMTEQTLNSDIQTGSFTSNQNTYNLGNYGGAYNNGNVQLSPVQGNDKFSTSAPFLVVDKSSDEYVNPNTTAVAKYATVVVLLKTTDDTTISKFKDVIQNLNVTISGIKLKPAGEIGDTSTTKLLNGGLSMAQTISKKKITSTKQTIKAGSIIPVAFDLNRKDFLNSLSNIDQQVINTTLNGTTYPITLQDHNIATFN